MVAFKLAVLFFSLCGVFVGQSLHAECLKCQDIRKYHAEHPEGNYEYYEDYLAEQEGELEQQVEEEKE